MQNVELIKKKTIGNSDDGNLVKDDIAWKTEQPIVHNSFPTRRLL